MSSDENAPVQEIVIIRRGGHGDGDGHHGGMWKIAFADFMTAMMAFFLVMWLINATDEKTQAQIANYFNPIKLPDQNKSERALQTSDSTGGKNEEAVKARNNQQGDKAAGTGSNEEDEKKPKSADEALFADPYGILSKLANQAARTPLPVHSGLRKDGIARFSGGTAFRDPFDPDFRRSAPRDNQDPTTTAPREEIEDAAAQQGPPSPLAQELDKTPPARKPTPPAGGGQEKPAAEAAKVAGAKPAFGAGESAGNAGAGENAVAQLDNAIRQSLAEAPVADLPDITVTRTAEGILISLTDNMDFEMFKLASAQPRPELVVAMEKIGKLLKTRGEKIVVRGHTDARPFRPNAAYDNWRLSSDRANIANFMLQRGGLPETQIERIEGYADKKLKVQDDPKAAANRRIEILLRQPV